MQSAWLLVCGTSLMGGKNGLLAVRGQNGQETVVTARAICLGCVFDGKVGGGGVAGDKKTLN